MTDRGKQYTLRDFIPKQSSTRRSSGGSMEDLLYTEPANPTRREQAMWRAIILQMITDAFTRSQKPEARRYKREALAWLNSNGKDFRMVCEFAGYDPHFLFANIQQLLCKQRSAHLHKTIFASSGHSSFAMPGLRRKSFSLDFPLPSMASAALSSETLDA